MIANDRSIIDRKQASRILGVSVRTLDRYIRYGKVQAFTKNGRILLNRKEVLEYSRGTPILPAKEIDSPIVSPVPVRVSTTPQKQTDHLYKDLYDEAKKILTDYHQKLEHSNYRIGQLESQVSNQTSPSQLHNRGAFINDGDQISKEFLRKEVSEKERELATVKKTLEQEQSARAIFAILTYLLLACLPIMWYLLRG